MKIYGVQSNQQTFGTRVYASKSAKQALNRPGVRRMFKNQIKELKNNGNDDVFVLLYRADRNKEAGVMSADLIKAKGNGYYYINPFFESANFAEKQPDGKNKYIDLRMLYAVTKEEELIPVSWWGKSDYEAFISKYKEL